MVFSINFRCRMRTAIPYIPGVFKHFIRGQHRVCKKLSIVMNVHLCIPIRLKRILKKYVLFLVFIQGERNVVGRSYWNLRSEVIFRARMTGTSFAEKTMDYESWSTPLTWWHAVCFYVGRSRQSRGVYCVRFG